MIQHYLKIALRNLLKYKTQTIISIVGLAIGFTCFALATLWVHYEMTYDDFHEGADRIYVVGRRNLVADKNTEFAVPLLPFAVHEQLKRNFPEIESSCACAVDRIYIDSIQEDYRAIHVDSCFMRTFNIKIQEGGTIDFLYSPNKVAITDETAKKIYGHTAVLGEKVNEYQSICAVVSGFGKHTNIPYDFLCAPLQQEDESEERYMTFIRLRKETDTDTFSKKLAEAKVEIRINQNRLNISKNFGMVPMTKYHYLSQNISIQISYLKLFAIVGGLVILCSLINYLFLFGTRLHIRTKEISLRKVCGSSLGHIYLMLTVEFLIILISSGLLGMMFVELVLPEFRMLSQVNGDIYGKAAFYFVMISILALCMMSPVILHNKKTTKGNRHFFRKSALAFQFCIGMLFIFCMIVLMKQISFLKNTDVGIERKGIASISCWDVSESEFTQINHELKKLPVIIETLPSTCALIPYRRSVSYNVSDWDNKKEEDAPIGFDAIYHIQELADFYGIKLKEGEMLNEDDTYRILINETAAKKIGVEHPIGTKLKIHTVYTIVGIVKDFHNTAPTIPTPPMMFLQNRPGEKRGRWSCQNDIVIKYEAGNWKTFKQDVDSIMQLKFPNRHYQCLDAEQEYEKEIRSENSLILILGIMSAVCILISAFGIFSFVTLSCEQRRKEIAVRKVNGATLRDILNMFAKEYLSLLVAASILAFPVGYALMKRWLEDYIEQTNISVWIYLVIFIGTALIITLCIGWRVWQAAQQNPAEVIKSE